MFFPFLGIATGARCGRAWNLRRGRDARHAAPAVAIPQRRRRPGRAQRRRRDGERDARPARAIPEEHRRAHGKHTTQSGDLYRELQ